MSGSLLLWMTLALIVFWSVGVYNRLMRMRARGLGALGSVMKHMRVYVELVRGQVARREAANVDLSPAAPVGSGALEWAQLLSALQALDTLLKDATANTLMLGSLAALGQTYDALQGALRQVTDMPADLAGPAVPAPLREHWELATQRVATARDGFNQLLTKYNEALAQFPASLVVATMGFKPSDML
jgi:LemA protein